MARKARKTRSVRSGASRSRTATKLPAIKNPAMTRAQFFTQVGPQFPGLRFNRTKFKSQHVECFVECIQHGAFPIVPSVLVKSKHGCPECARLDPDYDRPH